MSSAILAVPIHGAEDEVLELPKDQLPDDPNEIMQILANELAPLKLWLELAVSYYQQRRIDQFTVVMETSTGEEGPFYQDYYKDDKEGRIALLNCLAAYNTTVAARTRNKQNKDKSLARAVELYQQADKIDPNMALTYCGKGLVHMAKMSHSKTKMSMSRTADQWNEHLSQAGINFENAVQCERGCIPAILGKAAVQFNRRQYTEALKSYKEVLQLNPACPPEVRIGLAHCYAQLNQTEKAAKAFRRVLELAPDNVEALTGLAILEMNAEPGEKLSVAEKDKYMAQQVESAIKLLERAYHSMDNLGDQNAVVLNHLANHFVITNDLDKALRLAMKAFNNTEVKKIRAESCYHIARTHHIKGEFDQAHKYYAYAIQHWPEYLLPQYGLAQTSVHLNSLSEAMACLDKLLKAFPNSYEVRKLMGCVAHRNGDVNKALLHLTHITEIYHDDRIDEEVWVELGTLHEQRDPNRALLMYSRARDTLKRRKAKVPAELLNNIAALYHKRGFLAQAKKFYVKALKEFGVGAPSAEGVLKAPDTPEAEAAMRGSAVSVVYNLARLHEQMHELGYAEQLYRSLLKERPNYTDAYMRLGAMAEARLHIKDASMWYKEALTVSPHFADAYTALAKLHVKGQDFQAAQSKLEKILQKNNMDAYASITLGNIYLNNARIDKHKDKDKDKEEKSKEKFKQYLSRALDQYARIFHRQPNNVFAANGAAAVLFQTGRVKDAKQMFSQIREAAADNVPDVWINLAHAHLVQGEYIPAIKSYQAALDKFYQGNDVDLLRCIAHAEYTHSIVITKEKANVRDPATIVAKQREMLHRARRTLQRAMHLNPLDYSLQFNMVVVLKKQAEIVIENTVEERNKFIAAQESKKVLVPEIRIADLEQVKNDLVVMRRIAGRLAKIENEKEFPEYQRKIAAEEYEKYGVEMAGILPQYFEAVHEHHSEYARFQNDVVAEEREKKEEEERAREEREKKEEEERQARMEKAKELAKEMDERVQREDFLVKQPKASKARNKLQSMGDEDFIDDEAARGRLDKNKKGKGAPKDEEEAELIRCMEIFLAPSDDEGEEQIDEAQAAAAQDYLDSDDDAADGGDAVAGDAAAGGDEDGDDAPATGKKRSRLQRADDSDEEERPAAGDDAVAEEEEAPASAASKRRKRALDEDEDEEAPATNGAAGDEDMADEQAGQAQEGSAAADGAAEADGGDEAPAAEGE